ALKSKSFNNQAKPLQSLCCRAFLLFSLSLFPFALSACIWAVFERAENPEKSKEKTAKKKKKSPKKTKIRTADRTDQQIPDFEYDDYGNLVLDRDKEIQEIRYNHLNLPTKISFTNNREISYL